MLTKKCTNNPLQARCTAASPATGETVSSSSFRQSPFLTHYDSSFAEYFGGISAKYGLTCITINGNWYAGIVGSPFCGP
jgi:hypothetical protein